MELNKNDFAAKAERISTEIETTLKQYQKKHPNMKILPPTLVQQIFVTAISHYLEWSYNEGVGYGKKLQSPDDK